ncbi:MAG: hypothetical protein ACRD0P_12565 [Stackebrandtia sp.]
MSRNWFTATWPRVAVLATAAVLTITAGGVAVAVADGEEPAKKFDLGVMTYNVCADSNPKDPGTDRERCSHGKQTKKVSDGLAGKMAKREGLRVVMLQEICSADIQRLNKMSGLKKWEFSFAAIRDRGEDKKKDKKLHDRTCSRDSKTKDKRGEFGVGIGVKTHDVKFRSKNFSDEQSPDGRDQWGSWDVRQAVLCADVKAWKVSACGTHLTPSHGGDAADPNQFWKAQKAQVPALRDYAEKGDFDRVVFGGDLNQAAPDGYGGHGDKSTVATAYDTHVECAQSSPESKRDGRGTFQKEDGSDKKKIDYLFATKSAGTDCYVPKSHVSFADHLPVTATFSFG